MLFIQIGDTDRGDIWVLPLDKSAPPFPYLKTSAGELHPQFSPRPQSTKWIAYTSDESGIEQVYVRQFTGGAAAEAKWQISLNGGRYPRGAERQRHRLSRARWQIDVCSDSLYHRFHRGRNSTATLRRGFAAGAVLAIRL